MQSLASCTCQHIIKLMCRRVLYANTGAYCSQLMAHWCADEENEATERKTSGHAASSRHGTGGKAAGKQKSTVPALALPGLYKLKRAAFDPDLEGFSDLDAEIQEPKPLAAAATIRKDAKPERSIRVKEKKQASKEEPASGGPADSNQPDVKKRRALPGRLRKKLAKQRES